MNITLTKPDITVIPATKRFIESGGQIKKQKNLRVAAYCRVSTGDESQQTSYTTQVRFYTDMISRKAGWTMVDIYADEAASGTSTARRKDFNRMMDDAIAGRMDYIVTKSISRFARNTVDTLNCVRLLRQQSPPVGIYFEKENIDTLDATGELILTILSALAQDESRSISDNIRWAIQRKFQRGEAMVDLSRMLGYEKGKNGEWIINEKQAETVRYIYKQYACGHRANEIARQLNEKGIKSVRGYRWRADSILYILRNEKYVGDCEMQKTITKNFLTHEASPNNGEAPRYYVRDHHVGIIDRLTWEKVQAMLLAAGTKSDEAASGICLRNEGTNGKQRSCKKSPFSNLICIESDENGKSCAIPLRRLTYSGTIKSYSDERSIEAEGARADLYKERYSYYYPVWRCQRGCSGNANAEKSLGTIYETALEQSFMEMLYRQKRDFEKNGEQSELAQLFRAACEKIDGYNRNSQATQRISMMDGQIRELERSLNRTVEKQVDAMRRSGVVSTGVGTQLICENRPSKVSNAFSEIEYLGEDRTVLLAEQNGLYSSEVQIYARLAKDIQEKIDSLKKERELLSAEQVASSSIRKNFDFFIRCMKELPEVNGAGMKLNVNGLDVEGSIYSKFDGTAIHGKRSGAKKGKLRVTDEGISSAPDMLCFERGIYLAFIKTGMIKGDTIIYDTNFGVELETCGNRRTVGSFLGYRRVKADGTVIFLDEHWKVISDRPSYHRRPKNSTAENEEYK